MASVDLKEMLAAAVAAAEDKKAEDIRILALDPTESGLTDYFLICTGTNDRQTVAITDEIELRLKREYGQYPNSVEGRRQGEWILMDYVDFIVHVFLPEKRAFYGLERLRKSATTLSIADLNAEIKAAIKSKRPAKAVKKTAVSVGAKSAETQAAVAKIPDPPKKRAESTKTGDAIAAARIAKKAAKKTARKTPGKAAAKKSSPSKSAKSTKRAAR